jgi:hypothetical protein
LKRIDDFLVSGGICIYKNPRVLRMLYFQNMFLNDIFSLCKCYPRNFLAEKYNGRMLLMPTRKAPNASVADIWHFPLEALGGIRLFICSSFEAHLPKIPLFVHTKIGQDVNGLGCLNQMDCIS